MEDKDIVHALVANKSDEVESRIVIVLDSTNGGERTASSICATGDFSPFILTIATLRAVTSVLGVLDENFPDASERIREIIVNTLPSVINEDIEPTEKTIDILQ